MTQGTWVYAAPVPFFAGMPAPCSAVAIVMTMVETRGFT